ncbi:hypothetical protein CGRA01v4_07447 [Colletotrichum graminicola]|nr:hypothetical protein CGRA01v4_07447 [Colletotrichum graminicola]
MGNDRGLALSLSLPLSPSHALTLSLSLRLFPSCTVPPFVSHSVRRVRPYKVTQQCTSWVVESGHGRGRSERSGRLQEQGAWEHGPWPRPLAKNERWSASRAMDVSVRRRCGGERSLGEG